MEKRPGSRSPLPEHAKIFLYSDYTRGKSKERNPAAGIHGVSTTFLALTKTLQKRGYDAELISAQNLKYLISLPKRPHIYYPINPSKHVRRLREQPDVVGIQVEGIQSLFTSFSARRNNIPTVAIYTTNVSDYVRMNNKGIFQLIAGKIVAPTIDRVFVGIMNRADVVAVPSEEMKVKLTNLGVPQENIFVTARGVDRSIFHRKEAGEKNPYDEFPWFNNKKPNEPTPQIILYTGRISPEKNFSELWDIAHDLKPHQHIVFIGPPGSKKERDMLQHFEATSPNVHWLGTKEHEDLGPYYRFASVFVTPSMSETFGHTPNESLVSGIPVVVAKNQVMATRVDEGITGYTYESGDRKQLRQAIDNALLLTNSVDPEVFDRYVDSHMNSWDKAADNFLRAAEVAREKVAQRLTKRRG